MYYDLPVQFSDLEILDQGDDFNDAGEKTILGSVSGIGIGAVMINIIVAIIFIVTRVLRRKGLECSMDCLTCCKRHPDYVHPLTAEDRPAEAIPLQTPPAPVNVQRDWPVSVTPLWRRH